MSLSHPTLVLNCGSSSIKYALISDDNQHRITGLAENLGLPSAQIKHKNENQQEQCIAIANANHDQALKKILKIIEAYHVVAVGHRVVHGGHVFSQAVRITPDVIQNIKALSILAPLHNPANILGIEAIRALYPDIAQVAVFDTAFHQTMPAVAYRYAVPKVLYEQDHIRRYGFHGTSHAYVSERATQLHQGEGNAPYGWLTAHLGNGCSITAVYDGKSMDTSMGLTPLEGLMMGTRSGDIDPGLHQHLCHHKKMTVESVDALLNKQSGFLGVSGLSNDVRLIGEAASQGDENAQLAMAMFTYRAGKYLAALSCAIPTLTGIVFTGGIGENAAAIRADILAVLKHFAIDIDHQKNSALVGGKEGSFHTPNSKLALWVIPTDEEYRIAQETRQTLTLS